MDLENFEEINKKLVEFGKWNRLKRVDLVWALKLSFVFRFLNSKIEVKQKLYQSYLKLEQTSKISVKVFWKKISSFFKARNSSPEIYLWYMGSK
jgi:hypothetical protein